MDKMESLNHSKWECKYCCVCSEVSAPPAVLAVAARWAVSRSLAEKESRIEEGHSEGKSGTDNGFSYCQ
jgi:hypothetical protein